VPTPTTGRIRAVKQTVEDTPSLEDERDISYSRQNEDEQYEYDERRQQRDTRSHRAVRAVPLPTTQLPDEFAEQVDDVTTGTLDELDIIAPPGRGTVRQPYQAPLPERRYYGARKVRTSLDEDGQVPPRTRVQSQRIAYARRGRHEHLGYTHRVRSLYTLLQDIRHNRPLLITLGVVLVLLVLFPLVNGFIANTQSQTTGGISTIGSSNAGSQGPGQPTLNKQPLDPHELVITPPESEHPAPPVLATSAYLLDADTGATLYADNPFLHLPMMSTTKLMTATLAVEHDNLDQRVTITNQIAGDLSTQLSADSSTMGIKRGETYTLRELLYGLLLVSGNDAAIAIADTVGGNVPHFVNMMNQRAQQLGLLDTHYMNPHGLLADDHYSSAHDLALLGRYSLGLPEIHQISGTRSYTIPQTSDHPLHVMLNGNQFLWWYPGVDAGKPGWDGSSNFVQVVSVVRNGHHLIGVTMHTSDWWTDMRDLMNWGFDSFQWVSPAIVDKQHPIPYDNLWGYFTRDKQDTALPTGQGRYYVYTGYSVSGPVLSYFDQHGGLNTFGYPTSLPSASGSTALRQTFEHTTIQCDLTSNSCETL
jgi:D-alanyl-D-alanine carboxypeptidase